MPHYVIVKCHDEEIANNVASLFPENDVEVRTEAELNHGHIHADIQSVMSEMGLSEEQIDAIDLDEITQGVLDYDYAEYNEHIQELVEDKLSAVGLPVKEEVY